MGSLEVVGVRVDGPSGAPVLLLKDAESARYLPVWIGQNEAAAIVDALEGIEPSRPMTHDLFAEVLETWRKDGVTGRITTVAEGVFFAELDLGDGLVFTARPSDVVALAVRLGFPLTCPDELMVEVGVELSPVERDEVERFLEFLDSVNADDFEEENP